MPSACYRGFFVSINLIYRTAVHECLKVGSSHVDQTDPGLNGCPCDVGCDDAVLSAKKRIGLEHRLNADNVASIRECGSFRHGITVHKIECKVLHVKLTTKAGNKIDPRFNATWVKKEAAAKKFANSFSLKAIKLAFR
jgi:hypothetical protein